MKKLKLDIDENFLILHLEDMAELRKKMRENLLEIGVQASIVEAENLKEAKEFVLSKNIKFIISDWHLPDGTGFEFLKFVKSNPKTKDLPFIMCTTINEVANMLDAISNGANEFITKPWNTDELSEKFSSVFQKYYGN